MDACSVPSGADGALLLATAAAEARVVLDHHHGAPAVHSMMTRRAFLHRGSLALPAAYLLAIGLLRQRSLAQTLTVEELTAPLYLTSGAVLENKWYRPAPNFVGDGSGAMVVLDGPGIRIRGCRFDTGFTTWQTPDWDTIPPYPPPRIGVHGGMCGVRILHSPGLVMEDCEIDGWPDAGIIRASVNESDTISGALFRNVRITNCLRACAIGVAGGPPFGRDSCVHFVGCEGIDGWSAPDNNFGVGGGRFSWHGLVDSKIVDCSALGNMGTMKISGAIRCKILGCTAGTLNIAASMLENDHTDDLLVKGCTFDKNLVYHGPGVFNYNGIYIQGSNVDPGGGQNYRVKIYDTVIRCGTSSDLNGGHGTLMDWDSYADIRGCTYEGWNGYRDLAQTDLAYALVRSENAGTNADFATANTFINQTRLETGPNTPVPALPFPAWPPTSCWQPMMLGV